jgi:hypothetical protein
MYNQYSKKISHGSTLDEEEMRDVAFEAHNRLIEKLNKYPPDWKQAEEHGKANLCVDPSRRTL